MKFGEPKDLVSLIKDKKVFKNEFKIEDNGSSEEQQKFKIFVKLAECRPKIEISRTWFDVQNYMREYINESRTFSG